MMTTIRRRIRGDRSERAVLAVINDMHINSRVALCPPLVSLSADGGFYIPSKAQEWIYQNWLLYWSDVYSLVDSLKAELWVVMVGDLLEGYHHNSWQVNSPDAADQKQQALELLTPIADKADYLFVVRGTEAHAGRMASHEETLARALGAIPDDEIGSYTWWHLMLNVAGVTADFAHKPDTAGFRPWTGRAAAARQSAIMVARYAETGDPPPDICVFAHYHMDADSGIGSRPRVFYNLGWQLKTAFIHGIGAAAKITPVGGLIFVCEDGEYDPKLRRYYAERGERWDKTQLK